MIPPLHGYMLLAPSGLAIPAYASTSLAIQQFNNRIILPSPTCLPLSKRLISTMHLPVAPMQNAPPIPDTSLLLLPTGVEKET